ncbi:hypothetical protein LTR84_003077 [Exophiala bonariae]|uniref:Uncharacterized protein n=1 Tax=Exophiala bonariae TaxID=1690606 RepID=A0AAV9NBF8_9EURO|nr:hypothetical protein LTR84_003077 [Exophiala bonariae]
MANDQPQSYLPLSAADDSPHDQVTNGVIHSTPIDEPISPLEPTNNAETIPRRTTQRTNTQLTDVSETFEAARRHSSLSVFAQRFHGSVDPSLHSLIEKDGSTHKTSREYRYNKQRKRLLRLTIGEWFNSLLLCITYFGILWAYSKMELIDKPQRRIFNSLTTGNSLLLGVNLAASLRSYAKLLRWRMLAMSYRPLETFDLVMGCDSLINVISLLRKAKNSRNKWLPSRTQLLCLLWLLIHLAITILVGIIGLNYNLETSTDYVVLTKGTVSILDLDALATDNYLMDLATVQSWGVRGTVTTPLDWDAELEYTQSYFSTYDGHTFYYFQDLNANDGTTGHVTSRYIESYAYCHGYRVTEGQYGNMSYVVYHDGDKDVNQTIPAQPGPGGLLAISMFNSTCGARCTDINAFQAESLPTTQLDDSDGFDLYEARFFVCNNTVPEIGDDTESVQPDYAVSDLTARMLAGMLGWSSAVPSADGKSLYMTYTNNSETGFLRTPNSTHVANLISSFTMGGVAFMDDSFAMSRKYVTSTDRPIAAQYLHVTWRFAGSILAVIPFIHFWTLIAVIYWANRAIIKDDSHLAIAKVYHTLLRGLGDSGCLLQGDDIVRVLANPMVKYGATNSRVDGGYLHVDVLQRGAEDIHPMDGPFREGWYDGNGKGQERNHRTDPAGSLHRRYRDVDARDYF